VEALVVDDGVAVTALSHGGRWLGYASPTVFGDIVLTGVRTADRSPVGFRSAEVRIAPLEHGGRVVGAAFTLGEELEFNLDWGRAAKLPETYTVPGGFDPMRALDTGDVTLAPNPWPADTFFVAAHGRRRSVELTLLDGTGVRVGGATFARLLDDVRFFRTALEHDRPAAITLLVCFAAALDGPGGVAHDFQAVLASEFGYPQPVYGGTTKVELRVGEEAAAGLIHNGTWRRFPAEAPVAVVRGEPPGEGSGR
jgi:hypothetical protein